MNEDCSWPTNRIAEALNALAQRRGRTRASAPVSDRGGLGASDLDGAAVEALAIDCGFEAEAISVPYADFERTLREASPALVRLGPEGSGPEGSRPEGRERWLVLIAGGRKQVRILGSDGCCHRLPLSLLRRRCCHDLESGAEAAMDHLLAGTELTASSGLRQALLCARLSDQRVEGIWLLRLPPSAPFLEQLRELGVGRRLGRLLAAHALQYGLWLLAWWAIGAAALGDRLDSGWLIAWALLLATLLPLRLTVTWLQGRIAIDGGGLLKRRLLVGALEQRPGEIRRQGIGTLLGRVLESNAVETLAISGGAQALVALVELTMAAVVLALGAGGLVHVALLIAWALGASALSIRLFRRQRDWTRGRLAASHGLIERMIGHRTRLAQEPVGRRHLGEDAELAAYHGLGAAMDRAAALLLAGVPRGWLTLAVAALTPAFVGGSNGASLAVGIGGALLAFQAFERLTLGFAGLAEAAIAAQEVRDLFVAGGRSSAASSVPERAISQGVDDGPVIEAEGLTFRYGPQDPAIVRDASVTIARGERLLLDGPSGGGKSTLAALLGGQRQPQQGLLLLAGLDRPTHGLAGWRRRVAMAPQFHQNHIVTGTLAFNLLMGRRWPPTEADLESAERLCHALGLGDLLARMPAGLLQMVGETGWQLSHGERSRVFLARALLQPADLVILDESFDALDPENRAQALGAAIEQAPTLLVIAHA